MNIESKQKHIFNLSKKYRNTKDPIRQLLNCIGHENSLSMSNFGSLVRGYPLPSYDFIGEEGSPGRKLKFGFMGRKKEIAFHGYKQFLWALKTYQVIYHSGPSRDDKIGKEIKRDFENDKKRFKCVPSDWSYPLQMDNMNYYDTETKDYYPDSSATVRNFIQLKEWEEKLKSDKKYRNDSSLIYLISYIDGDWLEPVKWGYKSRNNNNFIYI